MLIIKRNNKAEVFSKQKLANTIRKAFGDEEVDKTTIDYIISRMTITEGMTTRSIQTMLEDTLMELGFSEQARKLIIYRHVHYHTDSLSEKIEFMKKYFSSSNAASGSKFDANANVSTKNIATLNNELFKGDIIQLNRFRMHRKITELYGKELADEYLRQLEKHEIYKHDETSVFPYCVAITMYPFLTEGLKGLGGLSTAPTNLDAFCGGFINLVFAVSSQFAGAVATGEFLMYFDYFARKRYGEDYYKNPDFVYANDESVRYDIHQKFQQVVYSMNQPAAARGYQAVFWNISYFDKYYFEGLFGDFVFPDGTKPVWDSLNWLQKEFMRWFNNERLKEVITFPVETVAMLSEGDDLKDKEWADFTAQMYAAGHSFFTYISDNPDSLSSCCRLRNEVKDNQFSYSLGAGGIATGSKSVMTINLNRCIQDAVKSNISYVEYLRDQVRKVHKYQIAFDSLLKDYEKAGALTVYDAGFISMRKQYLTVGVNGFVEAAEFLGIEVGPNKKYQNFCDSILKVFYDENKAARTRDISFNTEFVPAENLGVKHAKWDREDGYFVPRDCYNSYFYVVEDPKTTILDKFKLHGKNYVKYLDGGSALHMNLDEHLTKDQYRQLLRVAVKEGTNYFTFNIPNTICNDCGHISKRMLHKCPKCGSENLDYATRVIGYLKRISSFSEARQVEAGKRYYSNEKDLC